MGKRGRGRLKLPPAEPEPAQKRPVGHPLTYTKKMASRICAAIATTSRGLQSICDANPEFPQPATIYRWLVEFPEFREMYGIAKRDQLSVDAEEIKFIADTPHPGQKIKAVKSAGGKLTSQEVTQYDMLGHRELRIKTRQWIMARLDPKKWGNKVEFTGDADQLSELLEFMRKESAEMEKAEPDVSAVGAK